MLPIRACTVREAWHKAAASELLLHVCRCCITYLQVLIKPEIMPQGDAPPSLELAPGFKAPVPTDYASMKEYIETALPAESPIMYGMHTNAELSLLTSQVTVSAMYCLSSNLCACCCQVNQLSDGNKRCVADWLLACSSQTFFMSAACNSCGNPSVDTCTVPRTLMFCCYTCKVCW